MSPTISVAVVACGAIARRRCGDQGGYLRSYEAELHDFSSVVLDGTAPAATAEYAMGELRIALAMYRSAETKHWEKVWV